MPELVTRLPPRACVRLQASARALPAAAGTSICNVALPHQPNTWTGDDPVIWWVSPDAWLIQSLREGHGLAAQVRSDCMNLLCAVTDISDALATFALEGPDASAVLARGCGLDLHVASFGAQACARTRLAQLPVLIRRPASSRFELVVDRAVAQYLQDWLMDAAAGLE